MNHFNFFPHQSFHSTRLLWKFEAPTFEDAKKDMEKYGRNSIKNSEQAFGETDVDQTQYKANALFENIPADEEAAEVTQKKQKKAEEKESPETFNIETLPTLHLSENLSPAERQLRKEIWDKIQEQHQQHLDEKGDIIERDIYHIALRGKWVKASLTNRLIKQQDTWNRIDQMQKGVVKGVSDIDHFRYQERYYQEKKLERQNNRNETQTGNQQKRQDESELRTLKRALKRKKRGKEGRKDKKTRAKKRQERQDRKKEKLKVENTAEESSNAPVFTEREPLATETSEVALASYETNEDLSENALEAKGEWEKVFESYSENGLGHLIKLSKIKANPPKDANQKGEAYQKQMASAEVFFGDPDSVKGLQTILTEAGRYNGPIDGDFIRTASAFEFYVQENLINVRIENRIAERSEEIRAQKEAYAELIGGQNFEKITQTPESGPEVLAPIFNNPLFPKKAWGQVLYKFDEYYPGYATGTDKRRGWNDRVVEFFVYNVFRKPPEAMEIKDTTRRQQAIRKFIDEMDPVAKKNIIIAAELYVASELGEPVFAGKEEEDQPKGIVNAYAANAFKHHARGKYFGPDSLQVNAFVGGNGKTVRSRGPEWDALTLKGQQFTQEQSDQRVDELYQEWLDTVDPEQKERLAAKIESTTPYTLSLENKPVLKVTQLNKEWANEKDPQRKAALEEKIKLLGHSPSQKGEPVNEVVELNEEWKKAPTKKQKMAIARKMAEFGHIPSKVGEPIYQSTSRKEFEISEA